MRPAPFRLDSQQAGMHAHIGYESGYVRRGNQGVGRVLYLLCRANPVFEKRQLRISFCIKPRAHWVLLCATSQGLPRFRYSLGLNRREE
jgi:hypothetical protein